MKMVFLLLCNGDTVIIVVVFQLCVLDKPSHQDRSGHLECSEAIDYLVCSIIDKVKHEKLLQLKVATNDPEKLSQSKASADDSSKVSQSKRSADGPDRGTQVKRRRLAETPYDERPQCIFYLEGKCGKVRTQLVCSYTMFIL